MSSVRITKYNGEQLEDSDHNKFICSSRKVKFSNHVSCTPRMPIRKYRALQNIDRSKKFWETYKNFILCNRSIELRITKLFSFQNTQYIIAFSENFFEYTNDWSSFITIL